MRNIDDIKKTKNNIEEFLCKKNLKLKCKMLISLQKYNIFNIIDTNNLG